MVPLLPAADFATRFSMPTVGLRPRTWWRLDPVARPDLIDWDGRAGSSRFVSAAGAHEVLYLSGDKRTAFWEVFSARLLPLEPADRVLPPSVLDSRRWVHFDVPPGLKVFDATEIKSVRAIGASNASFHGDWSLSQAWSDAVWAHPACVDGILYRSDKNRNKCVAIFRRTTQRRLASIAAEDRGLLGRDGAFLSALRRKGFLR
jgi:RNase P/RNase MRP subunit POP5